MIDSIVYHNTVMNSLSLSLSLTGNDMPPCMYPEDSQVQIVDTEAVDGVEDTVSSLSEKESPRFKKKHGNGHIHSEYHHLL